jgi:rhodanese-related sulfurtransferase
MDEPSRGLSRAPESEDFGVQAQDALRPTESLHAPTPTSVPGARTIDTRGLSLLMRDPERHPMIFHVLGSAEHLPGAVAATPAGQGGSFDDATQREFGQFLQRMSRGDASVPMVFYCGGTHCWMSYNAALRAVHLGYRNVAWYRGGIEAWRNAGLPIEGAEAATVQSTGSARAPVPIEAAAMPSRSPSPTP